MVPNNNSILCFDFGIAADQKICVLHCRTNISISFFHPNALFLFNSCLIKLKSIHLPHCLDLSLNFRFCSKLFPSIFGMNLEYFLHFWPTPQKKSDYVFWRKNLHPQKQLPFYNGFYKTILI